MANLTVLQGLNLKSNVAGITTATLNEYLLTAEEHEIIHLYHPENKLIVYGTLAPGRPNHHMLASLKGDWNPGVIKGGKLESRGWGADLGFNGFVATADEKEQMDIPCFVFTSDDLSAHWLVLDDFEGEGYRRILGSYELEDGTPGVGYIYAIQS